MCVAEGRNTTTDDMSKKADVYKKHQVGEIALEFLVGEV